MPDEKGRAKATTVKPATAHWFRCLVLWGSLDPYHAKERLRLFRLTDLQPQRKRVMTVLARAETLLAVPAFC